MGLTLKGFNFLIDPFYESKETFTYKQVLKEKRLTHEDTH
jgi:hypothetical protein